MLTNLKPILTLALSGTQGYLLGFEFWKPHGDLHLRVLQNLDRNWAAGAVQLERFSDPILVVQVASHTASTIAALLHFVAVGVDNPVGKAGIAVRFNQQDLITADAKPAISQSSDFGWR